MVAGGSSSAAEFFLAWRARRRRFAVRRAGLCRARFRAIPRPEASTRFCAAAWARARPSVFAWSRMTVIQTGAIAAVAFVLGDYASQIVPLGAGELRHLGGDRRRAAHAPQRRGHAAVEDAAEGDGDAPHLRADRDLDRRHRQGRRAEAGGGRLGRRQLRADDDLRPLYLRRLERGRLPRGRDPRRPAQHGEGAGARHRDRHRALPPREPRLLQRARPRRHEGIEGDRGRRDARSWPGTGPRRCSRSSSAYRRATTINAAIFTGARTTYALGQDFPAFRKLGTWRDSGSTPANALAAAGRDLARARLGGLLHPGRLRGDGRLHAAGVLDLLPADGPDAARVPQARSRRAGVPHAAISAWCRRPSMRPAPSCSGPASTTCATRRSGRSSAGWSLRGLAVMALGIPLYLFFKKR